MNNKQLIHKVPRYKPPKSPATDASTFSKSLFDTHQNQSINEVLHIVSGIEQDRDVKDIFTSLSSTARDAVEQNILLGKHMEESNTVHGSSPDYALDVQPPPSNIWSAMKLMSSVLALNGDIWNTICIPAQVLFGKKIRISCKDKGAKEEWTRLFTEVIPINEWGRDCFFTVEELGQWFPLEYWEGKDLKGLSSVEPFGMWVGTTVANGASGYALINPDGFTKEKWESMTHDKAFTTYVQDLNIQTFPAFRVPIKGDVCRPVYGIGKKAYERYAFPHIARALKNIFYRMMLYEYKQGVIENFVAQIFMFNILGHGDNPPPKGAVASVKAQVDQVIQNRGGTLYFPYPVEAKMLKPETFDSVAATESWLEATQSIYRDIGFSLFWASGEIPGTHGRGGGVQVEIDVQAALERWESLLTGFFEWTTYLAKKWATLNDPKLLKFLPTFNNGQIGLKTQDIIKNKIQPLVQMGLLKPQTALEEADEDFDEEVANYEELEARDLHDAFMPPPTFAQTSFGPGGPETTSSSDTGETTPKAKVKQKPVEVDASEPDQDRKALAIIIAAAFDSMVESATRDSIIGFVNTVESNLRSQMALAYADGWAQRGGHGDMDVSMLNNSSSGVPFHIKALQGFKRDLLAKVGKPEQLVSAKYRASLYANAVRTAYVLGMQAAMKQHGANAWQRILGKSESGPCMECVADSSVIHPITDPFEDHPNGVCGMATLIYHFANAEPMQAIAPKTYVPGQRWRRLPMGGTG